MRLEIEFRKKVQSAVGGASRTGWNLTKRRPCEALIDAVPPAVTLMSESGIRDRDDVERLARLGVDAILVGEHLMREPDPGAAIASRFGLGVQRASRET